MQFIFSLFAYIDDFDLFQFAVITMGSTTTLNWNFQSAQTRNGSNLDAALQSLPHIGGTVPNYASAVGLALQKVMKKPPARYCFDLNLDLN